MLLYADLELSLHRAEASHSLIDFRFSQPESDADVSCRAQAVCPNFPLESEPIVTPTP